MAVLPDLKSPVLGFHEDTDITAGVPRWSLDLKWPAKTEGPGPRPVRQHPGRRCGGPTPEASRLPTETELIARYFARYPTLAQWLKDVGNQAILQSYTVSPRGRRRTLDSILSSGWTSGADSGTGVRISNSVMNWLSDEAHPIGDIT